MTGRWLALLPVLAAACDGDARPLDQRVHEIGEGDARLVGWGVRACSRGPATRARWCAFSRPAPDDPDRTELWAANVTRAMAGEPVPCDGSTTACVRVAERIFTGSRLETPGHPEGHRFYGDVLFFLAEPNPDAPPDLDRYEGVVWAWRPGWARARAITSERAALCEGSDAAPVAWCIDGVADGPISFDLRAGPLVERDGALPVVERITPLRAGERVWSAQLSPAGDQLLYSSLRPDEGVETLRALPLDGAGSPRVVVADGSSWATSSDGRAVYFVRNPRRVRGEIAGTLMVAELAGGAPVEIRADVNHFRPLGRPGQQSRGVGFITDLLGYEGVLHVARATDPAQQMTLSRDVHFWNPSPDGRYTYILVSTPDEEKGVLADTERGTVCRLGSRPDARVPGVQFLPALGLISWTESDFDLDEERQLSFLGRPDDCGGAAPLGDGVAAVMPVADRGLLLGVRGADTGPMSLWFVPVAGGAPSAPRIPLAAAIDADELAPVGDDLEAIVTRVGEGRGLTVLGPLR